MIIQLPHVDPIDTLSLPKDFEERVKESFRKYTEHTNPELTHEDKLSYLDYFREFLYPDRPGEYINDVSPEEYVKKLILDKVSSELNHDDFPDKEDIYSIEFMAECLMAGDKPLCPDDPFDKKDNATTLMVILKVIQIVSNWQPESKENGQTKSSFNGNSNNLVNARSAEILFRGKEIETGKWIQGFYINCVDPSLISEKFTIKNRHESYHYIVEYPGSCFNEWHKVYSDSLGEYTGYADDDKNEIFEGDIIMVEGEEIKELIVHRGLGTFLIDYNDNTFSLSYLHGKSVKIIGNVFDVKHPQPVEVKE